MAFWSEQTLEPKRQFRFKVEFGLVDGSGQTQNSTFLAQAADRPVYTIKGDTAVHFMDKQFMFPGKITWSPVKIRFVDGQSADTATAKMAYSYLKSAGWVNPDTMAGKLNLAANLRTINKNESVLGTKSVRVHVLNSSGQPVDSWTLKNPFITTVALNNLDYAQDGILTAEYTFMYDWAELEP